MRILISIGVGLFLFTLSACDKESTPQIIKATQASTPQTIKDIQGNGNTIVQSGRDTHLIITQQYGRLITKSDEYPATCKEKRQGHSLFRRT